MNDLTTQMPDTVRQFVAYDRQQEVVPDPKGSGEAITIRSQVFVRWLPNVKVKDYTPGGRKGAQAADKTVAVLFDAASIGWSEDVRAYVTPSDPVAAALKAAYDNGTAVNVGLETFRKNKDDQSNPIPLATPIHALRGAQVDGTKGSADVTGKHATSVVAAVDGQASVESRTELREWPSLVDNRKGFIAPKGWSVLADAEEWQKLGVISLRTDTPEAALDSDALKDAVYAALVAFEEEKCSGTAHRKNNAPTEGAPWTVRTSDGRMNLGNYAVETYGHVYRALHEQVAGIDGWTTDTLHTATPRVLSLIDKLQISAYAQDGKGAFPVARGAHSYRVVWQWVLWHIGHADPLPAADATDDQWAAWEKAVGTAVVAHLRAAGSHTDEHFKIDYAQQRRQANSTTRPQNRPSPAPSTPPAQQSRTQSTPTQDRKPAQPNPQPETTSATDDDAPRTPPPANSATGTVATELFNAVQGSWGDVDRLAALADKVVQRKVENTLTWARMETGGIAITAPRPGCSGGVTGSVSDILSRRIGELKPQQDSAADHSPTPSSGTPESTMGVSVPAQSAPAAAGGSEELATKLVQRATEATTAQDVDQVIAEATTAELFDMKYSVGGSTGTLGSYLKFLRSNK